MIRRLAILIIIVLVISGLERRANPTPQPVDRPWTIVDSKAYAKDSLYHWADNQFVCLSKLWGQESSWNPRAFNKHKVMGKNAGGIPQLLGLDPDTPAPIQIDRGLAYIKYRYTTPCLAWAHHKKKGWY